MNNNLDACYNESILLIGPMCAGKTTIFNLLQSTLYKELDLMRNLATLRTDIIFRRYLKRTEYDFLLHEKFNLEDEVKGLEYFQGYNFDFTLSLLEEIKTPMLIEFGGTSTLTFGSLERERLKEVFKRFKNVVLLLPVKDKEESVKILQRRWENSKRVNSSLANEINRKIVYDPFNEEISTIIVYTEGRSIEEIVNEIIEKVKENKYSYRKKGEN